MIVFVDYEHADRYKAGKGSNIQAARTWISYRLEDLSGMPSLLVRWTHLTATLLEQVNAKAIFISGNSADPAVYDRADLAALHGVITGCGLPIFGFCGGFQCVAQAFGAELQLLDVNPSVAETDMLKKWPNGLFAEVGYHPIELVGQHPLLDGLGATPIFRHAHGLHVSQPPAGFEVLARTEITPVQLAVNNACRIVGTQFHPEYWTDEYPAGKTLIANFLRWANVT